MKTLGIFAFDPTKDIHAEVNSGEILVTENPCLSVQEILTRFAKGIPVNEQYRNLDEGEERDDDYIDLVDNLDYSADKPDMAEFVKEHSSLSRCTLIPTVTNERGRETLRETEQRSGEGASDDEQPSE